MNAQMPVLIVVVPLLSAFAIAAAGWFNRRLCMPTAAAALGVATLCTLGLLLRVIQDGEVVYRLGGWAAPWGIVYRVDFLNAPVLVLVAAIALVNLVATSRIVVEEFPGKEGAFYALYVLFVTGLLGMVVTGDAFNLYVLLEIASITGYALIAMGRGRAVLASLNYVFMGTIGACFYLLGIGYLYIMTGSLNMTDIASFLPPLYSSKAVITAFIIIMVGVWLKMALFPLHGWLPNAYTYAPSSVSSLVAPLMTKVMVYVMIRIILTVFTPAFTFRALGLNQAVVWLAVAAIFMGSLMALAQRNLKRMLTYILIAEVGYMVGGAWLGNRAGLTGAVLHILNDGLMTFCLFLAAGNILYRVRGLNMEDLRGLFRKMPFTMGGFVIGALSIIGVPPTCGFFSKWYLILGGIQAGHYGFVVALLFSSLVNLILFFRIIEVGYFEPHSEHRHEGQDHAPSMEEAPVGMVVSLLIVASGLILAGLYAGDIVQRVVNLAIPESIV
jgi:multicomponent Na+:H+ antiporter subunit D